MWDSSYWDGLYQGMGRMPRKDVGPEAVHSKPAGKIMIKRGKSK